MMGWVSRLRGAVNRKPVEREANTFVPREWNEHFRSLTPEERRVVAAGVCRKVLDTAALQDEDAEQALSSLVRGQVDSDVLRSIHSRVERLEAEYESLVDDDESRLSCSEPEIGAAFVRARAATALQYALEGDLGQMAYEAWFVLNDLDELRRLAGMPPSHR